MLNPKCQFSKIIQVRFIYEEKMVLGSYLWKTAYHPGQNIFSKHQMVIPIKDAEIRIQPES